MSFWPVSHAFAPTSTRIGPAALMLAAVLAVAGSSLAQAPASDPLVAVVNGIEIHESDVRMADEEVGRNLITQDTRQRREELITMLIDTILLSQEAVKQKIVDEADLQRRMTFARNRGLMNNLLIVAAERAATDEAVRKAYDDLVASTPVEQEVHLRQIIFKTAELKDEAEIKAVEEKAKAALARLKNGEDFSLVAAEMSDDPLAKANGGDFGWRIRSELGKEYAEVAFVLRKGEVGPLIKTAFGWHIIKLEDQRPRKPLSFELARERMKALVERKAQVGLINAVRENGRVERKDRAAEAK